jgi:preprotein translocase subunit SecB
MRKNTQIIKISESDYEQFLKSVKPVGLGLVNSSSQLDRGAYGRLMSQKKQPFRLISTEYRLLEAESGYFDASGKFSIMVTEEKKSTPALVIECTFETHFHCKSQVVRELAERFTASELRLVLWPYFRELVFDMCGKMSIPSITIPLTAAEE